MAEVIRRVRPTPLAMSAYLANPHRGCCTFQHFNGDALFPGTTWSEEGPVTFPPPIKMPVIDGYLPTTVAYCRWFWRVIEPEKGKYDFTVIDKALETASQRGQTLAARIMSFGSAKQPQLPEWYLKNYKTVPQNGVMHPVHDSPEYFEHWGALIREFGRRYDGKLENVTMAYLGPWGEGAGECRPETCAKFAQCFKEAFPNTIRLTEVATGQFTAGIASGAGWRVNCYGDLGETGSPEVPKNVSWNHTFDSYPMEVTTSGAKDTWRHAPVFLETGWVPGGWYERGWDIDFIIEQGIKYHPTYFMPKYTALPEPWMERLSLFSNRIGYRFILRQALFDRRVPAGGTFRFQSWIENVGIAPIYRKYDFALRLRQGDVSAVIPFPEIDIRTWQPEDTWLDLAVKVPPQIKRGWAELSAGLVEPGTADARVRFAVKEQFSDGWVDLQGVEIV
jgi:hypothetical protein